MFRQDVFSLCKLKFHLIENCKLFHFVKIVFLVFSSASTSRLAWKTLSMSFNSFIPEVFHMFLSEGQNKYSLKYTQFLYWFTAFCNAYRDLHRYNAVRN